MALSGHYSNPVVDSTTDESPGQSAMPSREQRQKQVRLGQLQVDELVSLYQQGQTIRQLVEHFGVHKTTVSDHLKRRGVATRVVERRLSDADVAKAAELYQAGQSLAQVAQHFGVYDTTIYREFKKADIPTRPRLGPNPQNPLGVGQSLPTT